MPARAIHDSFTLHLPEIRAAMEASIPKAHPDGVAALTRRLARGDEAAFREFHVLYFDRLLQFLLVVARGKEHEAQEALQETLLRVVRYVRVFETEEAFWGWLKVVARTAARDRGRKQQRYLALLERVAHIWREQPLETGAAEEDRLRLLLEESLAELEAADRSLVEGKYLDDESVNALSSKTGLTDKAVESRLLRLRRSLRERILKKLSTS